MPRKAVRKKAVRKKPIYVLEPHANQWFSVGYASRRPGALRYHQIKIYDFMRLAKRGLRVREMKTHPGTYDTSPWGRQYTYKRLRADMKAGKPIDPMELWIRPDCQVAGHEGRHRAAIADYLGIKTGPLVLTCENDNARPVDFHHCEHCMVDFPNQLYTQSQIDWSRTRTRRRYGSLS